MTGRGRDLRGDPPEGAGITANRVPGRGDSAVRTRSGRRVQDRQLRTGTAWSRSADRRAGAHIWDDGVSRVGSRRISRHARRASPPCPRCHYLISRQAMTASLTCRRFRPLGHPNALYAPSHARSRKYRCDRRSTKPTGSESARVERQMPPVDRRTRSTTRNAKSKSPVCHRP